MPQPCARSHSTSPKFGASANAAGVSATKNPTERHRYYGRHLVFIKPLPWRERPLAVFPFNSYEAIRGFRPPFRQHLAGMGNTQLCHPRHRLQENFPSVKLKMTRYPSFAEGPAVMGLSYHDLDQPTRFLMIEEINLDVAGTGLYVSRYLNESGAERWEALTLEAASTGTDDSLAAELARGCMKAQVERQKPKGGYTLVKVPYTAPQTLAEAQFNMYYMRALATRALSKSRALLVYRAKYVEHPRPESEAMIGSRIDPRLVLDELRRTKGVDPSIRIPLPNSGLSVRLA